MRKFEVEAACRDEEQRFRGSKDVKTSNKLRNVTMKIRKHTGRAKVANKHILAGLRNKKARRRLPGAAPDVLGRGGRGSMRIQAVGHTTALVSGWYAKIASDGTCL